MFGATNRRIWIVAFAANAPALFDLPVLGGKREPVAVYALESA